MGKEKKNRDKDYFDVMGIHTMTANRVLEGLLRSWKCEIDKEIALLRKKVDATQLGIDELKKELESTKKRLPLPYTGVETSKPKPPGKPKGKSFRDEVREVFGKKRITAYGKKEDFTIFGRGTDIPRYVHAIARGNVNEILARWVNADPNKRMPLLDPNGYEVKKILCRDQHERLAFVKKDSPEYVPMLFSEEEYEKVIDGFVKWYNKPYNDACWVLTDSSSGSRPFCCR